MTPAATGKRLPPLVIALSVIIALLIGLCIKFAMDRSRAEAALHAKP